MLQGNAGMQSRFQTTLMFEDWTDINMIDLILSNAADTKFVGPTPFVFEDSARAQLEASLQQLRSRPDFGNGRDAETLLKLTIESRDVRVGNDPNQLRTSPDGRLLLMRDDVIEATRQMLSSRGGISDGHFQGSASVNDLSHSSDCFAEHNTRFLQQVFPELQQHFADSVDLSVACSQMLAAGVTDESILRSSNAHDDIARFFPDDDVTVHFLDMFMQLNFRQRPVSACELNALAFGLDAVVAYFAADIIIIVVNKLHHHSHRIFVFISAAVADACCRCPQKLRRSKPKSKRLVVMISPPLPTTMLKISLMKMTMAWETLNLVSASSSECDPLFLVLKPRR